MFGPVVLIHAIIPVMRSKPHVPSTESAPHSSPHPRAASIALLILSIVILFALCLTVRICVDDALPVPRSAASTPLSEFSEERAMGFVRHLVEEIGIRESNDSPFCPTHDPSRRSVLPYCICLCLYRLSVPFCVLRVVCVSSKPLITPA